ncbi:hypothetical protein TAMA11512_13680 [Selenomonas sp. TAMA-11512]|uniref:hydrogenase n=1 Tax=Selenomonas sp. TAMA-11512 TaxID=3095337 RepID=UPI00308618B8|nr:hypothetical protein TAMA11512_13680 [Selenomonas sp. TAMA-11512]
MEYIVVSLLFVVFLETRIANLKRAILCLALQSGIVAGTCVLLTLMSGEDTALHTLLPGILTLIVKVLFIPGALWRLAGKIQDEREIFSDSNVNYSTAAAAIFLVLGYLLAEQIGVSKEVRSIIASSIMMIMTGLALMAIRRRAIMQVIGLITMENGIYLLGLLITEGLPLVVELGVFLDVLIAVVVLVILTNHMSLSFMTTDTTVMRKLKG